MSWIEISTFILMDEKKGVLKKRCAKAFNIYIYIYIFTSGINGDSNFFSSNLSQSTDLNQGCDFNFTKPSFPTPNLSDTSRVNNPFIN